MDADTPKTATVPATATARRTRLSRRIQLALAGALGAACLLAVLAATGAFSIAGNLRHSQDHGDLCYLWWVEGEVVAEPGGGTGIITNDPANPDASPFEVTLAWPAGVTSRQNGSEVQVIDEHGRTILVSGKHARITGGYENDYFAACPAGITQ